MMRVAATALRLSLMGVAASAVFSVPLNYSESVNGELTGQNVGALDVGLNTVQGQVCGFGALMPAGESTNPGPPTR